MSLFELCGWALCPSFVPLLRKRKKARESKRKQEKERKLQEKGRSERQVELDTCSVAKGFVMLSLSLLWQDEFT